MHYLLNFSSICLLKNIHYFWEKKRNFPFKLFLEELYQLVPFVSRIKKNYHNIYCQEQIENVLELEGDLEIPENTFLLN